MAIVRPVATVGHSGEIDQHDPATRASLPGAGPELPPWVLRAALALALVPLVVSAVNLSVRHRDYAVSGDLAMTELVTRDVGRHAVALGPYSRDGWHHPGPALYHLLAPPYRLLGSTSSAMDVGALLVNGAAVAGMALLARRRGGVPLALVTLLGCSLLMRSLGPDELRLPWNPYVTVLPYGLLVFLTWSLASGDRWALPVAVLVASYLAQTHIGYVALALPLVALGTVWLAARGRRGLLGPSLTAVGVAAVLWLPPAVQQLANDPGNLSLAMRWFREGGPDRQRPPGLGAGWRVVSSQYGIPPEWLFGDRGTTVMGEPVALYDPVVPVLLLAVLAAGYVLWRRRTAGSGTLVAVWLVASAAGLVATARTVRPVYDYRLGWTSVLGLVGGVIVGWAAWTSATDRRPALERRVLAPVALVSLAVLGAVGSVAHVRADRPLPAASDRLGAVVPAVVDGLPPGRGDVVIDGHGFEAVVYRAGLVLALERRGVDARMPAGEDATGAHRTAGDGQRRADLVVATAGTVAALASDPTATLVAYDGDLSLAELRARVAAGSGVPYGAALAVFRLDPPLDTPAES